MNVMFQHPGLSGSTIPKALSTQLMLQSAGPGLSLHDLAVHLTTVSHPARFAP